MEIRQLKYFISIAECGSFTEASRRCFLSQSAISQQIKLLEDELNTILFNRSTHHTTLTESGESFLVYAKKILADFETLEEEMSSINGELCGTLNIGIGSFIEPYLRKPAALMLERHPKVKLNVTFDRASRLNRLLREHELDIAFTMNQAYDHEGIHTEKALDFHLSCIMRKDHFLASTKKVAFQDLLKERVILPEVGSRAMETIRRYYDMPVERMNAAVLVNNADAAINMVLLRNYITFLPKLYVDLHSELYAKPIEGLEMPLTSNVHYLKSSPLKKSAQAFLDIVKECYPQ